MRAVEKSVADASPRRIGYEGCPLCEAALPKGSLRVASCAKHPLYRAPLPAEMTWLRCESCGHVFTDGYWSDEAERLIFSAVNDGQRVGQDFERQRMVAARMVERVQAYQPTPGRWLDVGFGNAALLFTAQEFGYEPVGLDLRGANVKAACSVGVEAYCADIQQMAEPGSPIGQFSVISMADVLEHMPFPSVGLNAARSMLAPGGTLLISMPAYDSPLWKYLDGAGANPYWGELEHYHNFSRERLYALLSDFGFTGFEYGVSHRYRACMEVLARRSW